MRYQFEGPQPVEDPVLGLVRPCDVRDLDAEPDWGPWRLLDEPPAPAGGMQRADVTEAPPPPSGPVTVPLMTATATGVPFAAKGM